MSIGGGDLAQLTSMTAHTLGGLGQVPLAGGWTVSMSNHSLVESRTRPLANPD